MTNEQAIARGHRAFNEMSELNGVFDKLESNIIGRLKSAAVGNDALIVKLHMQLHTLSGIRSALREMIDHGRMAEAAAAVAGLTRPD